MSVKTCSYLKGGCIGLPRQSGRQSQTQCLLCQELLTLQQIELWLHHKKEQLLLALAADAAMLKVPQGCNPCDCRSPMTGHQMGQTHSQNVNPGDDDKAC